MNWCDGNQSAWVQGRERFHQRRPVLSTPETGNKLRPSNSIKDRAVPYCLHISRPTEDPDEDLTPIPLEEWRAAVAVTEGVRLFAGKSHIATLPTTGQVIKVSGTRAMPKSSFQAMIDGTLSLRGSKAQLRLPFAWIRPMHQTLFGRWGSLLLRAWAP